MEHTNTTNFLRDESNDNIKSMLEQDIATTARQACDLRHPQVLMQAVDCETERQFEAYFQESLSEDDHAELMEHLHHNFGEENVHVFPVEQFENCHMYKVVLHVAK